MKTNKDISINMESTSESPLPLPTKSDREASISSPAPEVVTKETSREEKKEAYPKRSKENSNPNTSKRKSLFNSIPRTVRWRLQLGLLSLPPSITNTVVEANSTQPDSKNKNGGEEDNGQEVIHNASASIPSLSPSTSFLKDILTHNESNLQKQRERYDILAQKHLWENSPLALIEKEEQEAREKARTVQQNKDTAETKEAKVKCNKGSDPLSAMLMENEKQDKKNTEEEESNDKVEVKKEGNSSWSEFYSSRETLSLIEKDLHRLSPSHYIVTPISTLYAPSELPATSDEKNENPDDSHNDGENTDKGNEINVKDIEYRKKQRTQLLSQILFIYARQNPSLGYRQGMHEILSFILIAFEVDFHNAYNRNSERSKTDGDLKAQHQLFLEEKISHDAFLLFETIMYYLSPAYDSASQTITPPPHLKLRRQQQQQCRSRSMMQIAETAIQQVRVNGSEKLYSHLTTDISIPPQLYCARWVRLMFTREITSVHKSLFLWDKIFYIMHRKHCSLLPILEYICAAMILRIQDQFHIPEDEDDLDDPNDSINLLMNYPQIDDVKTFWKTVSDMIEGKLLKVPIGKAAVPEKQQNAGIISGAMNRVQNMTGTLLMGTGRPSTSTSSQQNYQKEPDPNKPQQSTFGVLQRMNNIYNGTMSYGKEETFTNHQQQQKQYQPFRPEDHKNNKHVFGDRYNAQQTRQRHNEQFTDQKDAVNQTISRVANTWNKAIDSLGGSLEQVVVGAASRVNHVGEQMFQNQQQPTYTPFTNMEGRNKSLTDWSLLSLDQRLSRSVITMTKYLKMIQQTDRNGGAMNVPSSVWEAVAQVDAVSEEIRKGAAKEKKDTDVSPPVSPTETQEKTEETEKTGKPPPTEHSD